MSSLGSGREKHGDYFRAVKKSCIIEVRELDKVIQRELKLFVASGEKKKKKRLWESMFAILDKLFCGIKKEKKKKCVLNEESIKSDLVAH